MIHTSERNIQQQQQQQHKSLSKTGERVRTWPGAIFIITIVGGLMLAAAAAAAEAFQDSSSPLRRSVNSWSRHN